VDLPAALFEQPVHRQALYEAVRNYLANQRQGTHDTKTRAEVVGSKQKMFRQKGTGRARDGLDHQPQPGGRRPWRTGRIPGITATPCRRRSSVLALKFGAERPRGLNERINVLEDFELDAPKTKTVAAMLAKMALEGRHTLFVVPAGAKIRRHLQESCGT
jgi:large subunit ribosomal protein L4